MIVFALAAALPVLYWDAVVDTAQPLRDAGIERVAMPANRLTAWRHVPGVAAEPASLDGAIKLPPPSVNYKINDATASRSPWLVESGWRFVRTAGGRFYYDARGKTAALAAAEAFCYGEGALVRTDAAGLKPLGAMLRFLKSIPEAALPPVADIGYVDDGTPASGEVMNLLIRSNLLFRVVSAPDPRFRVNVKLGTADYPSSDAQDPSRIAHLARAHLTDERRSIRVFGSDVVVARLYGAHGRVRLHLINYDAAERKIDGIRIRVTGRYEKHQLFVPGAGGDLLDYTVDASGTEFTVPELASYAVVDLWR